jgi:hypothetical protein
MTGYDVPSAIIGSGNIGIKMLRQVESLAGCINGPPRLPILWQNLVAVMKMQASKDLPKHAFNAL